LRNDYIQGRAKNGSAFIFGFLQHTPILGESVISLIVSAINRGTQNWRYCKHTLNFEAGWKTVISSYLWALSTNSYNLLKLANKGIWESSQEMINPYIGKDFSTTNSDIRSPKKSLNLRAILNDMPRLKFHWIRLPCRS
jgi:hypothetical protein